MFTEQEYCKGYEASAAQEVTLSSLAWLWFTNRPLLFLGCSLEKDRTVRVLRGDPTIVCLACVTMPYSLPYYSSRRREQREKRLRELGISPLWFAPGIVRPDRRAAWGPGRANLHQAAVSAKPADATLAGPARNLKWGCGGSMRPSARRHRLTQIEDLRPNLEFIGRALGDGRSRCSSGRTRRWAVCRSGTSVYAMLAIEFRSSRSCAGDRTAVAAFVVSRRGEQALWQEVRTIMTRPEAAPGRCTVSWPHCRGS